MNWRGASPARATRSCSRVARTIGLNGPTAEHRWGPIGARARSVNSSFPGSGYLDLGFEYDRGRPDCMLGISVDDVEATAQELIRV